MYLGKGFRDKGLNQKKLICFSMSLCGLLGLVHLFEIMGEDHLWLASFSFFSIIIFGILYFFQKRAWDDLDKMIEKHAKVKRLCNAILLSFLFSLTLIVGYMLMKKGMTYPGFRGKAKILVDAFFLSCVFFHPANSWFRFLEQKVEKEKSLNPAKISGKKCARSYLCFSLFLFLGWMPVFFAFYPGILSYDFNRQAGEAYRGFAWFNDHHPLLHTALIRFFFQIGQRAGDLKLGMALYSIFQMAALVFVFSYACCMMIRLTGKKWTGYLAFAFFFLLPIHPVMALSVTKDTFFTAFFLLFCLLLLERKFYHGKRMQVILDLALLCTGILMIFFRNNAIYALALFSVFWVITSQGERLRVFLLCFLMLISGFAGKNLIRSAMGAGQGSKVEMYSVFIMQMGRVAYEHQEIDLSAEDEELLETYIPRYAWKDYIPAIADSIKGEVGMYCFPEWKDDIPGMLKDWAKLGKKYPNEYLDAFLMLTSGYWFLDDVSHARMLGYGDESGFGLLYTFDATPDFIREETGLSMESKFPMLQRFLKKIVNGNRYSEVPVLSNLFKPAFYVWIFILCTWAHIYQKKKAVMEILPLSYLLTLLMGPAALLRYIYPIVVLIPLLLAWTFSDSE